MEEAFKGPKPAPGVVTNFHLLSNSIIDIEGDKAKRGVEVDVRAHGGQRADPALAGMYLDTFVRENGKWKFLRREAPAGSAGAGRRHASHDAGLHRDSAAHRALSVRGSTSARTPARTTRISIRRTASSPCPMCGAEAAIACS